MEYNNFSFKGAIFSDELRPFSARANVTAFYTKIYKVSYNFTFEDFIKNVGVYKTPYGEW